jgi:hypothetical protein
LPSPGYPTRVVDQLPDIANTKTSLLEMAHEAQGALSSLVQAIEAMPD